MDNLSILIGYESVDGGVNNLQICKVIDFNFRQIIKVFTSKNMLAEKRAKQWIQKNK